MPNLVKKSLANILNMLKNKGGRGGQKMAQFLFSPTVRASENCYVPVVTRNKIGKPKFLFGKSAKSTLKKKKY